MIRLRYFLLLLLYITGTYLLLVLLDNAAVDYITAEDHYFENVGALSLFIGSFCLISAFWMSRGKLPLLPRMFLLGFAFLLFFGGGEEISWGQRIFHFATPEVVEEVNAKEEFNVHNLDIFHDGGKNTLPFKAFQAFWFAYALLIPIAATVYKPARAFFERFLVIVPWSFGVLFLANFIYSSILGRLVFLGQPGEIQESNHEMLFLMIGIYIFATLRHRQTVSKQQSYIGEPAKAQA